MIVTKNITFGIFLILVLSITVTIPIDVMGYSFVGVTSNGVEFPISQMNSESTNSTDSVGDGDSILDGLGVYLTIQNIGTNGMVYFGDGDNPGKQTDIRAYVEVGQLDDWVVAIDDNDIHETLSVPEFGVQYTYYSGSLVESGVKSPNVLGYSESRILSGDVTVTTNDDGIVLTKTLSYRIRTGRTRTAYQRSQLQASTQPRIEDVTQRVA